jgi:hypothetical protein
MPALQTVFSVLIRFETELWSAVDARLRADCDLSAEQARADAGDRPARELPDP